MLAPRSPRSGAEGGPPRRGILGDGGLGAELEGGARDGGAGEERVAREVPGPGARAAVERREGRERAAAAAMKLRFDQMRHKDAVDKKRKEAAARWGPASDLSLRHPLKDIS